MTNDVFGSGSTTVPSTSIESFFANNPPFQTAVLPPGEPGDEWGEPPNARTRRIAEPSPPRNEAPFVGLSSTTLRVW